MVNCHARGFRSAGFTWEALKMFPSKKNWTYSRIRPIIESTRAVVRNLSLPDPLGVREQILGVRQWYRGPRGVRKLIKGTMTVLKGNQCSNYKLDMFQTMFISCVNYSLFHSITHKLFCRLMQ